MKPLLLKKKANRLYYYLELARLEDWPAFIKLSSKHFIAFIATDAMDVKDTIIKNTARKSLKQGLVSLSAWGVDCERVHDIYDHVIVNMKFEKKDIAIFTSWHEKQSLKVTIWDFIYCTFPDDYYKKKCSSWLTVSIGNKEYCNKVFKQIERGLKTLDTLSKNELSLLFEE